MSERILIWEGRPSQVLNFFPYLKTIMVIIAIVYFVPLAQPYMPMVVVDYITWKNIFILCGVVSLYAVWKYLTVRCHKYSIHSDSIFVTTGVFSPDKDPCDMYRVKDESVQKPFYLRIFGLGNIKLVTSDHSSPILIIKAVRDVDSLLVSIREAKMIARKEHGVREFD